MHSPEQLYTAALDGEFPLLRRVKAMEEKIRSADKKKATKFILMVIPV